MKNGAGAGARAGEFRGDPGRRRCPHIRTLPVWWFTSPAFMSKLPPLLRPSGRIDNVNGELQTLGQIFRAGVDRDPTALDALLPRQRIDRFDINPPYRPRQNRS